MYQVNEITFRNWDEAERERRDFRRRFGISLPVFTNCPEHGFVESHEGHCLKCMLEVYEDHLEEA